MSYTTFECSPIRCEKTDMTLEELKAGECFSVSVTLSNTGNYDGKETVQLYIRDKVASVMRPMRELKAFEKVWIPAHSSREVTFEIGYDALGFYRENGEYVVEPGLFEVYIGGNCLTDNLVTIQIR